jgi:hypothetical protein
LLPSVQQLQTFHALWLALCPCLASAGETKDDSSTLQAGLMVREYVSINIMVGIPRSKVIYTTGTVFNICSTEKASTLGKTTSNILCHTPSSTAFHFGYKARTAFKRSVWFNLLHGDPDELALLGSCTNQQLGIAKNSDNIPPCTSADYLLLPFNHQKIQLL